MKRYGSVTALSLLFLAAVGFGAAQPASAEMLNSSGMPSLAPVIKQVTPAVVNISTRGVVKRKVRGPFMSPLFRQFFGIPENGRTISRVFTSLGSGVIIDAEKGYILTNYHVIRDAKKITVTLYDNRQFQAKVIGSDPASDIAVVQIDADDLHQIALGDSSQLQVGDYVVAIGNPLGFEHTATFGIISGLSRPGGASGRFGGQPVGTLDNYIQTDAAINPGNSGGALINLRGQLVGINAAIATTNGGNIGIGFAIPVNMAKVVMQQLIKYGEVKHGVLGVYIQPLSPALAKQFGLSSETKGALVTKVMEDSAADKAGLKQGDVITAVNGHPVVSANALSSYIGIRRAGTPLTLTVYRDGEKMTIHAKIGESSNDANTADGGHHELGATFGNLTKKSPLYGEVQGVVVETVDPNGAAAMARLRPGDVITAVNRHAVENLDEFKKLLERYKGESLLLKVRRGNGIFFTVIR
ncbi:MAG: DegQ family serine endoprotease [Gammaproteobacteria bacterium]|nr:DegQ family serine endoprotease [Gammaproteobacteria bacterium]